MSDDVLQISVRFLAKDRHLGSFVRAHGPLQHRREHARGAFRSLSEAIIYQQLSGKAAGTIRNRFVSLFPGKVFPTPADVLHADITTLRSAGLSQQKAGYVQDLARAFSDGTIVPRRFKHMSDEEIIQHVTTVKGVGEWTAQMFLMFTLGRPDVLPTKDLGIQKGFQKLFSLKALPTPSQMTEYAECWRGHRTVACFYLWRLADTVLLDDGVCKNTR